jgi:hypothetical protein
MNIKIGDKVQTHGYYTGIEGIVTKIIPGENNENHGTIEIRVTKVNNKKFNWLKIGSLEHFVHFNWQDTLTIL